MLNDRRYIVPASIGAICFLLLIIPAQLRPENFLADDTYFYLQVAYNIFGGHGSTFNLITPTNGYHPLWLLFCVAGMALAGGDKTAAIHIVLAMQGIMLLCTIAMFFAIARLLRFRHPRIALPIFGVYFLTGLYGSEAHINGLMLAATIYFYLRSNISGKYRDAIFAGLAMGFAFLARLDNILVIIPLIIAGIFLGIQDNLRRTLRRISITAAAFTVVALPYLLYNALRHGHILPISGAIKSSFPRPLFAPSQLALLGGIVAVFSVVSLILSLAPGVERPRKLLLRGLGSGVLLQCIYIACFMRSGSGWSWYYVAGVMNAIFAVCIGVEIAAERGAGGARWLLRGASGGAALLLLLGIARSWYRLGDAYFTQRRRLFESTDVRQPHNRRKDLALWMKAHLPAGSGVYVDDGPGALAYYSDLRILPRDGLISDFRYNDDIMAAGPERYFREHRITYYLGPILPSGDGSQDLVVPAPLYDRPAGTIHLDRGNLLLKATDDPTHFAVGLWRLPG